ncbi:MAG: hypothetical protein IID46_14200 [Planctomycetes bacterium]|nr:hypothetical protein [Planctomycetota bacterium]
MRKPVIGSAIHITTLGFQDLWNGSNLIVAAIDLTADARFVLEIASDGSSQKKLTQENRCVPAD